MHKQKIKTKYLVISIILTTYFPSTAFASLFVPTVPVEDSQVYDSTNQLNGAFNLFKISFDRYTVDFRNLIWGEGKNTDESLRSLLSLNPEQGKTAELYLSGKDESPTNGGKTLDDTASKIKVTCKTRPITDPDHAKKTQNGAWEELEKRKQIDASETDYSMVQVNDSTSLTCLLQEIVEYNKLQINLQIHSLLRDYINNALSVGLAQRQAGLITKANIDWARKGISMTTYDKEDGTPLTQENFSVAATDLEKYKQSLKAARSRTIKDMIVTNDTEGRSFGVCEEFKYSVARYVLTKAHSQDKGILDTDAFSCASPIVQNKENTLFATEDNTEYYDNGPIAQLEFMSSNPQNNERALGDMLESKLTADKQQIDDQTTLKYQANGGFLPTTECDPTDPNCDPAFSKDVTPGSINSKIIGDSVGQQMQFLNGVKSAEDLAAAQHDGNSSTDILNMGLDNYNTSNLSPNQNVSRYIGEFVQAIHSGYFDLQNGTKDWATGAMLQIYDNTMQNSQAYTGSNGLNSIPNDLTTN